MNFEVTSSKLPYFFQKLQLLIIGSVQIFESHQQNCLIFAKILPRDNRGSSNILVTSVNLGYFELVIIGAVQISKSYQQNCFILGKLYLVIVGVVQNFKSHQQNSFILGKRLPHNNKARSNFQVKSSKRLYFVKNFSLW